MEAKRLNFITVRRFMRDSNLTPLAKCILFDLILYAGVFGEPYPSQIKLAGDQGCSDRQVRRALNELCGEYTEAWVEDAINVAANRNLPYLKVGLISEILEDWRKDGKPEPKPIFQPCGKNGCENGNIFHPERYTYSICECREQFDKELKEWKEKWGESQ